jgi:8-oxo-dGTP pyrophosphatase MutT (NUDIX family)
MRCGVRYLCVQQSVNKYWGFVKGGIEDGEIGVQCARRELKEEVGLDIELECLEHALKLATTPDRKYGVRNYTFYLVDVTEELPCTIDQVEISAYAWMDLDTLKRQKKASFTTNIIKKLERLRTHLASGTSSPSDESRKLTVSHTAPAAHDCHEEVRSE